MNIRITFPEGKRVDADFGVRVVHTDQSVEHGGAGTANGGALVTPREKTCRFTSIHSRERCLFRAQRKHRWGALRAPQRTRQGPNGE
jgi:hypothetical protein